MVNQPGLPLSAGPGPNMHSPHDAVNCGRVHFLTGMGGSSNRYTSSTLGGMAGLSATS